MMTRFRVVLPPDSILLAVVLVFALFELPYVYFEWKLGQPLDVPRPGLYALRMLAFAYGCWRVQAFHPAYIADYRAWLERSPWTGRRPLPGGPIALAWEDALPLGALAIMARFEGPSAPVVTLGMFLAGYLFAMSPTMWSTGVRWCGYALLFGLGLALRCWPDPAIFLGSLVAAYAVAWVGLRASLARFPWPKFQDLAQVSAAAKAQENTCGWPFDQLQPKVDGASRFRMVDGFLVGLLGGWYLFAAESLFPLPGQKLVLVQIVFGNGVVLLAAIRTLIYCAGLAPPISLWGRIRTFRWIVPGFDQVFLAPLCTLLVGVLAFDRFRPPGLDDLTFLPAAFAVAIAVAVTTGPSFARWRLTGKHRIVANFAKMNQEYVKVG